MLITKVDGKITKLDIHHDTQIDTVVLLITSDSKIQWQLVLEKSCTKYVYHLSKNKNNVQQQVSQDEKVENVDSKNFHSFVCEVSSNYLLKKSSFLIKRLLSQEIEILIQI